jgi:hypothetical protein
MTCRLRLYADINRGGSVITWRGTTGSENVQNVSGIDYRFGYNKASSYEVGADKHCMIVGYTWNGGGIHHYNGVPHGDIKMFKNGVNNDLRNVEGRETRHFNDDLDGIRLQFVPGANSGQMQYPINIPAQKPHNYFSPRTVTGEVLDSNGTRFTPCPGGTAYFNSQSGITCIYDKSASALQTLHASTKYSNMANMHTSLAGTFCSDSNKVFESPGGDACLIRNEGKRLAKEYCSVGSRIRSDPNCTKENMDVANYDEVAKTYCNTATGRADTFCKCHNITSGVCDAHPTAAGCAKKKQTFDKLVEATPSDQRDLWSGMESCFGRVCTGTGVFIPPNSNQNCDKSVNVCIQDIDIGSMTDSNIQATCDIDAGSPPSVSEPSTSTPSQSELEEAGGDPGAQEGLDAVEEPPSLTDFQTNPKAYIPKSLEDLKTNEKKQMGAFSVGMFFMFLCLILLLVVGSGGTVQGRRGVKR